jgi:uncharacterized membrane protein
VVQLHLAGAFTAIGLGAWNLVAAKGTGRHRIVGRVWVSLMVLVAASSFWITGLSASLLGGAWRGWPSPIHLLSVLVLVTAPLALWSARAGRIVRHRRMMLQLYFLGLILTGMFTLAPGRLMHRALFG